MRIALGAIVLQLLWLPLYEVLREGSPWVLAALAAGPLGFAAAAIVGPVATRRQRWSATAKLAGLSFALDLAFELWTGRQVPVATSAWELARLGSIAGAVALAGGPTGRRLARGALGLAAIGAMGTIVCLGLCLQGALPDPPRATDGRRADAAIVLGFALTPDGRAAPSLFARVRHAARLYRDGVVPRLVLTGGRGDGVRAESAVADEIAQRAGVPAEAIVREELSRTTAENLTEAARIARRLRCRSVLLVTEPFHMARAMLLARAKGLPARPSPAASPLWRLRSAPYWVVREVGYMPRAIVAAVGARPAEEPPATVELVESAPVETTLDHADLRDAYEVWPERFARARRTIDLVQFYASNEPGSRLEPVVRALLSAADRGVTVRFLADAGFARTYPDTLARLDAHGWIVARTLDMAAAGRSGVLHEKAFVIDGEELWLGSQNFDWRSLTHIQELGVLVRDQVLARAWSDLFERDWSRTKGGPRFVISQVRPRGYGFPRGLTLVASPRDLLLDESLWDLPHLLAWMDGARRSLRVQLLTFGDDEGRWPVLSDALRRAAARGVKVEVIVSNWAVRPKPRGALARLLAPGLTVKIATIPPAASGFVPFARVVHAKYMVVDGARAWIGTSNWERDYFHDSRNVGLLIEARPVARRLEAFFGDLWSSGYVERFDPRRSYPAPRIAE